MVYKLKFGLVVLCLHIISFTHHATGEYSCPPPEDIKALGCTCFEEKDVDCTDVLSLETLEKIVYALQGYELRHFSLLRSNLVYLPSLLFRKIKIGGSIAIHDSAFQRLRESPILSSAFEGTHATGLELSETKVIDQDFDVIGDIEDLQTLNIKRINNINLKSLISHLKKPERLMQLVVSDCSGIKEVSGAFSPLKDLYSLHLEKVSIETLLRSDFNETTEKLKYIYIVDTNLENLDPELKSIFENLKALALQKNKIAEIPEGIFGNFKGTLVIKDNPLRCGEQTRWLSSLVCQGNESEIKAFVFCDDKTNICDKNN